VDPDRTYRTPRLLLRPWRDDDRAPFAAMSADPAVMEHFPAVLDRAASDRVIDRLQAHLAARGYTFWAVEAPGVAPFVGFVGLLHQSFAAPWTPGIEIGWRIAREHWGQGYAPEAAAEALRIGFEDVGADEIVAITVPGNAKSRRVMTKLGMTRDGAGDFDHPELPADSPLRRHLLYRLARERWAPLADKRH
jgi:RimJ/RimL family protein N-acetyltransferase